MRTARVSAYSQAPIGSGTDSGQVRDREIDASPAQAT